MKKLIFSLCALVAILTGCNDDVPALIAPPVATPTIALTGEYILHTGVALKTLALLGIATADNQEVKGIFAWKAPDTTYDKEGKYDAEWIFTPDDIKRYNKVEGKQEILAKTNWTAIEQVTLSQITLSLIKGASETLTATITPADATEKEITWSSSNEQTATVDATGKVTAQGAGEAIITATASGNKTATCTVTVTVPTTPKKVYVIGNHKTGTALKALFWIDGIPQTLENEDKAIATSLFVSGTDSYITGIVFNGDTPVSVYWKNGKIVSLTDQGNNPHPTSIFVSGDDVYVAGNDLLAEVSTAGFWKNGKFKLLNGNKTEAKSIFVSGNNVYIAGRNTGTGTAILWENGSPTSIPEMQDAVSVSVSGDDVYVAGYDDNAALYTNGTVKQLFNSSTYATSMFVSGSNVYITVEDAAMNQNQTGYWENETIHPLTDGAKKVGINSIYVADGKVYVAGSSFIGNTTSSTARIWVDGVVQSLSGGDVAGSEAIGIVVK